MIGPEAVVVANHASVTARMLSAALPVNSRKTMQTRISADMPATASNATRFVEYFGLIKSVRFPSFSSVDEEHQSQGTGQQNQNTP